MTETRATYETQAGMSKAEFTARPCCKRFDSGMYEPPTQDDWRAFKSLSGLSQNDIAKITGTHWSEKGAPTVRRWATDPSNKSWKETPYAAWRLLLVETGFVAVDVPDMKRV